ncbi:NAD-P-binding protein [Mycena galericulata]|nr:NAD-P-binding protein [Mycena galericulata]
MTSLPQTTTHYYLREVCVGETAFENLNLKTSPIPPLADNEVLVKVHAVSLQARDLMIVRGLFPSAENLIPGSDMAGEILAIGDAVVEWAPGDRVCANFFPDYVDGQLTPQREATLGAAVPGVLTQFRAFPAHSLVRIPAHLSYDEASTLPCAALTAYNALRGPEPVKAGDTVLIEGTGGVSIFALQFAAALGAHPIVTSSSDEKLTKARTLGAKDVVNYTVTPEWDEEVLKLTNGVGVDYVLEIGGPASLTRAMNAVRMYGNIEIIGASFTVGKDTRFPDVLNPAVMKALKFRGVQIGSVELFRQMNMFIEEHGIRPVVDRVFAFAELREAYEYLQAQTHVGKIVVRV